jgi:hypothetical protein
LVENGQAFSALLKTLVNQWPIPVTDLVIIGSSLGGLVSRSACHYEALAGYQWLPSLSQLIFCRPTYHGSPSERWGNWVDTKLSSNRYTASWHALDKFAVSALLIYVTATCWTATGKVPYSPSGKSDSQ